MDEKDKADYRFKLNLLCVIENIITIICFTVLAVVFDEWWIVFFSGLFFSKVERDEED